MEIEYDGTRPFFVGEEDSRDVYTISIFYKDDIDNSITFPFGQSIHNSEKEIEPTPYDIISCILPDSAIDPETTFNDFCNDFGYDNDSIRAQNTYNSCIEFARQLQEFFTPEQFEDLQEIQ